jgi:hypothetical protein
MEVNKIITESLICDTIFTIDPGRSNGAIVKYSLITKRLEIHKMEKFKELSDFSDYFRYQKSICKLPVCFMEKITSFPSDYNKGNIGKAFNLDKLKDHFVELRTSLKLAQIPTIEIMPRSWQQYLNHYIAGEDYKIRKARFKDIAKDEFSFEKVTLWNADALLLVQFAKKKLKYDSLWVVQQMRIKERKTSLWNTSI